MSLEIRKQLIALALAKPPPTVSIRYETKDGGEGFSIGRLVKMNSRIVGVSVHRNDELDRVEIDQITSVETE